MGSYGAGTVDMSAVVVDSDLNMGNYSINTGPNGISIDGLLIKDKQIHQPDMLMPQNKDKVASDNLRHSVDAQIVVTSATYIQVTNKTLTFTHGIKGVLRVKCTIDPAGGKTGYYKLLKDGAGSPLATEQSVLTDPLTGSDDLTVDWVAGTTLNVFAKQTPDGNMNVTNFRVYYDDGTGFSAVAVAVTGAD